MKPNKLTIYGHHHPTTKTAINPLYLAKKIILTLELPNKINFPTFNSEINNLHPYMTKNFFKDTRPGPFYNQVYEEIKTLKPHPNPPSKTAIIVKNMYGSLVWKEPEHLIPTTKLEFQKQRT